MIYQPVARDVLAEITHPGNFTLTVDILVIMERLLICQTVIISFQEEAIRPAGHQYAEHKRAVPYLLVVMTHFAILSHKQRRVGTKLSQPQDHDKHMSHVLQNTSGLQVSVESETRLLFDWKGRGISARVSPDRIRLLTCGVENAFILIEVFLQYFDLLLWQLQQRFTID